jgi:hypothetical protein
MANKPKRECYIRMGKVIYMPVDENGGRAAHSASPSINKAKKESRKLMAKGEQIHTSL